MVASLIFAFFVGMLMNPNLGWLFILEILASVIILLILVLLIAKIWIMKNDGIWDSKLIITHILSIILMFIVLLLLLTW